MNNKKPNKISSFFNWVRSKLSTAGKYQVEVHVNSHYHGRGIAKFYVTAEGKSKAAARANVEKDLFLTVGKMDLIKKQINGHHA
ncbi:MAG: hypothetical protein ACK5QX_01400 [bacterium]|jgi:hypothetical protein